MNHPSKLALDRQALGRRDPEVAAHLGACERCRAHMQAVSPELVVPRWVPVRPRRTRAWTLAGALALAATLVLVLGLPTHDGVRAKGGPSVTVWVKRGEEVREWRGERLAAGDAVRLELMPAGYSHVAVVHEGRVLWAAEVDPSVQPRSPSWTLDAQGAQEALQIVFSRAPIEAPVRAGADRLVLELILPKESQR